jgi:hypothetical protein
MIERYYDPTDRTITPGEVTGSVFTEGLQSKIEKYLAGEIKPSEADFRDELADAVNRTVIEINDGPLRLSNDQLTELWQASGIVGELDAIHHGLTAL